jgi:hypothetical protein
MFVEFIFKWHTDVQDGALLLMMSALKVVHGYTRKSPYYSYCPDDV